MTVQRVDQASCTLLGEKWYKKQIIKKLGHFIAVGLALNTDMIPLKSEISGVSFLRLTTDILLLRALTSTILRKFRTKTHQEITPLERQENDNEG